MDKSWGVPAPTAAPARAGGGADDGADRPAIARATPASERAEAMARRQEARLARREADLRSNEQARTERREREQLSAAGDPHAAAAKRHRSSGRKDVVREQRDTSGYTTVVDADRIRSLAKRGASPAGLAAVFGISEQRVDEALADGD